MPIHAASGFFMGIQGGSSAFPENGVMRYECDVLVIGGGHAGVEAATSAVRAGRGALRVTLLTGNLDSMARMSCNPAIGGVGKGHLVREIDAIGGVMGRAIDATGIQFRMLNRSKGSAMHGPRAQADRHAYARWVRIECENTPGLTMREEQVVEIRFDPTGESVAVDTAWQVTGVRCRSGAEYVTRAVVLCCGTFLDGVLHYGVVTMPGGRSGDEPAVGVSDSLRHVGIQLERFKTGTPMRISRRGLDLTQFEEHNGDRPPTPFSFLNEPTACGDEPGNVPATVWDPPQVPCWITWTNDSVHQAILGNLDRAPMYTGQITTTGPRYCPSVETKVVRFRERERHQIILEPEGRDTSEIYVNGLSTSLPPDVQEAMVRAIPGMERAEILRFGYAIEYDYVPPDQLRPTLETKPVAGLYLAGQLCGTTGYEEAAALGLIAGTNAALSLIGVEPLILGREQAYIGVMIDDLVTIGVDEPYRMFTSRAEYRLRLRHDSADRRLTPIGWRLGLVEPARWAAFEKKETLRQRVESLLRGVRHDGAPLIDACRRPGMTVERLESLAPELCEVPSIVIESVLTDAKYAGYIEREDREVAAMERHGRRRLPPGLDYRTIRHLRPEAVEKLNRIRPLDFAQAQRIPGITPADLFVLRIGLESTDGE